MRVNTLFPKVASIPRQELAALLPGDLCVVALPGVVVLLVVFVGEAGVCVATVMPLARLATVRKAGVTVVAVVAATWHGAGWSVDGVCGGEGAAVMMEAVTTRGH